MNAEPESGRGEDEDLSGDGEQEKGNDGNDKERQERQGSPLPVPVEPESGAVDAEPADEEGSAPASDTAPVDGASDSRRWQWLASAAVAAALSVVVVLTLAYVVGPALVADRLPSLPETGPDPRIAAIESRVAAIESLAARIDGLESRLGSAAGRADSLDGAQSELGRRIGAIEQRASALESSMAAARDATGDRPAIGAAEIAALRQAQSETASTSARLSADLERLAGKIGRLGDARGDGVLLLLAAWRLEAAVEGAAAFTDRLDALVAVAGDDAEIARVAAVLSPLASGGTPSFSTLRERFGDVGRELIRAESVAQAGEGWVDQTLARVKRIVTVRREGGGVAGEDAAAVVSRAEAALAAGDLQGAVAEIGSLGADADAYTGADAGAGEWLAGARARLALTASVAAIMARAIERLDGQLG